MSNTNSIVLAQLAKTAQQLQDAASGADKKAARTERNRLIVVASAEGIEVEAIRAAAGIKNVSSYYDVLRAAKVASTTQAAKAKVSKAAPQAAVHQRAELADEPRFAKSPITQAAIRQALSPAGILASARAAATPEQLAEANQDEVDPREGDGLLRFATRYRTADGADRKRIVHAMDEDDAFEAVAALAGPRGRVVSVKRK